jgi:hypothetical protein
MLHNIELFYAAVEDIVVDTFIIDYLVIDDLHEMETYRVEVELNSFHARWNRPFK